MRPDPPPGCEGCELVARRMVRRTITPSDPEHALYGALRALRRRLSAGRQHADLSITPGEQRTILRALRELDGLEAAEGRADELERRLARAELSYRRRDAKPEHVLDVLLGKPFSRIGAGLLPWEHRGRRRGTVNKLALARDYLKIRHGTGTVELCEPLEQETGDLYQALAVSDCPREPADAVAIVSYWHRSQVFAVRKHLFAVKRSAKARGDLDLVGRLDLPANR